MRWSACKRRERQRWPVPEAVGRTESHEFGRPEWQRMPSIESSRHRARLPPNRRAPVRTARGRRPTARTARRTSRRPPAALPPALPPATPPQQTAVHLLRRTILIHLPQADAK